MSPLRTFLRIYISVSMPAFCIIAASSLLFSFLSSFGRWGLEAQCAEAGFFR
jgi:hypothetical protein